jgi:hypothetical protein
MTFSVVVVLRDELPNKADGMFPFSLFLLRSRNESEEKFAHKGGIALVRLLFRKPTMEGNGLVPKVSGILPARLLFRRNKYCSLGSRPIPDRIVPLRLLLVRLIFEETLI